MLARLAGVVVVRRRLVLVLAVLFLALAGGIGGGVAVKGQPASATSIMEPPFFGGAVDVVVEPYVVDVSGLGVGHRIGNGRELAAKSVLLNAAGPAVRTWNNKHTYLVPVDP